MSSYLRCVDGAYYFRIAVPRRAQGRFGRAELVVALGTRSLEEAKPLAMRLAADCLSHFAFGGLQGTTLPSALALPAGTAAAPPEAVPPHARGASFGLLKAERMADSPEAASSATHAVSAPVVPVASSGVSPQRFLSTWRELLVYWRDLVPGRPPLTCRDFERSVDGFVAHSQCKRPIDVTRPLVVAYRDHLLARGLAPSTVTMRLGQLAAVLAVGYDAGALPANHARGIRVPRSSAKAPSRLGFTRDELTQIFSTRVYTHALRPAAGGGEAAAWLPALALATGGRLEELAQLRVDDLEDIEGGWVLHIRDEVDGQRVKTASSRRRVPLHEQLVAAGLLRYRDSLVRSGEQWLFPALALDHDGRRGGNFGKWWGRWLRSPEGAGITDRRKVFHSFRHGFKTLCREAGVPEEIHDALTGHAGGSGGVGRSYGAMPLAPLRAAMLTIKLPVDLPTIVPEVR